MQTQSVKLNPDGTLELPSELRETLKDVSDLTVSWDERVIVIEIKSSLSKKEKLQHFFNAADKLQQFNQVEPFSEDEIREEIDAYRSEKYSRSSSL
jgi:hypothetical protein